MLRQMRVANHGMSLSFFLLSYRVLFVVSTQSLLTHTRTPNLCCFDYYYRLMAQALNNETGTANGEDDMSVYGGNKGVPVERDNDDDAFLRGLYADPCL